MTFAAVAFAAVVSAGVAGLVEDGAHTAAVEFDAAGDVGVTGSGGVQPQGDDEIAVAECFGSERAFVQKR